MVLPVLTGQIASASHDVPGRDTSGLRWQDISLTKLVIGILCTVEALCLLVVLNNSYGMGTVLGVHMPKQWLVGSHCRLLRRAPAAGIQSKHTYTLDCRADTSIQSSDSVFRQCVLNRDHCQLGETTTAVLEHISWDVSQLRIRTRLTNSAQEIDILANGLSVTQSNRTRRDGSRELIAIIKNPDRRIGLWSANYLLAVLLGLGVMAILDACLLLPSERARQHAR